MLFISNKYTALYFKIIENARQNPYHGFTESHHIIPKALGGDNSVDNLVDLSAKEHWYVHKLLPKMTTGDAKRKMLYAFGMFRVDKTGNRILTAKQYEESKLAFVEAHSKRIVTEETRAKLSITSSAIPVDHYCIHCNRMFTKGKYNQFHGDKCKLNVNIDPDILEQRKAARTKWMNNSESLERHRSNIPKRARHECPHCKRTFDAGNFKIWHGDKCKLLRQQSPD